MARSLTSELTSGRADAFIGDVAKSAGAVVRPRDGLGAVQVSAMRDALEIRLHLPPIISVLEIEQAEIQALKDADYLPHLLERRIRAAAAELRGQAVLSLLDRQYPIDFVGGGTEAEQAAARLLEEAARLLRRAAGVRGQALEERAAAVDVAMDAALSGRPAEAGAILRREGGA